MQTTLQWKVLNLKIANYVFIKCRCQRTGEVKLRAPEPTNSLKSCTGERPFQGNTKIMILCGKSKKYGKVGPMWLVHIISWSSCIQSPSESIYLAWGQQLLPYRWHPASVVHQYRSTNRDDYIQNADRPIRNLYKICYLN